MGRRSRKRGVTAPAPPPVVERPRPRPAAPGPRARMADAPKAPWSPFPLTELVVLLSMALIVGGVLTDGGRRGALLGCGFALVSLAGPGAGAPRALRGLPLALDAAGRGQRDRRRRAAVPVDRPAAGRPARHRHRRLRPRADAPAPRLPRAVGRDGVPRMTELPTPEPRRMRLLGLHHVTMICSDLQRTTAFYRDLLGLALVRETVNDDDPDARHFWFGDGHGTAGTLLSFMEYPQMEPGKVGVGSVHHVALAVASRRRARRLARLPALALGGLHRRVRPRRPAVDLPARSRREHRRDRHGLGLTDPPARDVPASPLPWRSSQATPTRTGVRLSARSGASCGAPLVPSICASA